MEAPERPVYPKLFSTEHGIAATFGRRGAMEADMHAAFRIYWRKLGIPVKAKLRGKYRNG